MQKSKVKRFLTYYKNIILIRNVMIYKNCNYILLGVAGLLCFSMSTNFMGLPNKFSSKDISEYHDKVLGSLVGGALGDALGAPTEFISSLEKIKEKYSPAGIIGIESLQYGDFDTDREGNLVVPYTDDTGMALPLFRVLVDAREKDSDLNTTMDVLARSFVTDMNNEHGWSKEGRAPGNACKKGVEILENKIDCKQTDDPQWWAVGGSKAGGCGSVMRAHPAGLVFAHDPKKAEEYAIAQSILTHGDPIALAASAAQAVGVAAALRGKEPKKIVELMIKTAQRYDKTTACFMEDAFNQALNKRGKFQSVDEAITGSQALYGKYQGWPAHEAIAATIYTFTLYPDDLKAAIRLGANTPGDSDSIASMTGALVGARTGLKGQLSEQDWQRKLTVPRRWGKGYQAAIKTKRGEILMIHNGQIVQLEGFDYINRIAQELVAVQQKCPEDLQEFTFDHEKFKFGENNS